MLDTNQDGFITMDEAKNSKEQIASEIINGLFQFADINNDKMISLREFSAVMEPTEIPTNNDFLKIQQARRLMALIDQNSDRKLTVEEVHKYANQNGEVKINEIEDVFSKLDTNKDGWLVINELKNIENHISIINKRINRV